MVTEGQDEPRAPLGQARTLPGAPPPSRRQAFWTGSRPLRRVPRRGHRLLPGRQSPRPRPSDQAFKPLPDQSGIQAAPHEHDQPPIDYRDGERRPEPAPHRWHGVDHSRVRDCPTCRASRIRTGRIAVSTQNGGKPRFPLPRLRIRQSAHRGRSRRGTHRRTWTFTLCDRKPKLAENAVAKQSHLHIESAAPLTEKGRLKVMSRQGALNDCPHRPRSAAHRR